MQLIDAASAENYLRQSGRIAPGETVCVRELTGGVSNMVLLVERPSHANGDLVLKQARAQLRTAQPWFSSVERVWREAAVLRACRKLLERSHKHPAPPTTWSAQTPRIVFEDRDNFLFAMTAAPRPNRVWKQDLLAGMVADDIATACGRLLGTLHGQSWRDDALAAELGDRSLFDELRIDPYYRTLAAAQLTARPAIERLLASLAAHPRSLVHADFSPKNLLVFDGGLMMVDFETGHFGDPAFDLGFFLSHLALKACLFAPDHERYLQATTAFALAYDETMADRVSRDELAALWSRGIQNFAGCAWARLDGKSPVEYLSDERKREQMRSLCRQVFDTSPTRWSQVTEMCSAAWRPAL